MSETTKRALNADLIDLSVPWCKRIDRTHLAARPVDRQAPRPSTLPAEGGVERETTNSLEKIGTVCTGRKIALDFRWLRLVFVVAIISGIWEAAGFWVAVEAVLAVWWWDMFRNWRASERSSE